MSRTAAGNALGPTPQEQAGLVGRPSGDRDQRSGQSEYDAGQSEYDAGQSEYDAGQSEYDAGQSEYDAGQREYDAGQSEYDAGQSEYGAGQSEYDAGQSDHDTGQSEHDAGPSEHDAGPSEHHAGQSEYDAGKSEHDAGQSEHDAGQSEHDAGQSEYDAGQSEHDAGQTAYVQRDTAPRSASDWDALLADGVDTWIGGVLYLINLMLHLDLPACFEEDWRLDSEVGPWGALELLGRGLLTTTTSPHVGDPLWTVLARADDRPPDSLPGEAYVGSQSFRLPPDWLEEGEAGQCFWTTTHDRLWLWSERGYLLAALPRDPVIAAPDQARQELRLYGITAPGTQGDPDQIPLADCSGPWLRGLNPALQDWLACVLPYIALRLREALGEDDLLELLHLHARLYLTMSHLDLVARLDAVRFPVRAAGLDRNPGWLRDWGRVIYFHFK
jgi:hypothetical protein